MTRSKTREVLLYAALGGILVAALIAVPAFAQSADQAILEWDAPSPLTEEVRVYRAPAQADNSCPTPPAGYALVATVDPAVTTYTDSGLAFNQRFCWYVTAWNQDHPESEASNLVWKRIPFPSAPPAITNLREVSPPATGSQ